MIDPAKERIDSLAIAAKWKIWPRRRGGKRVHYATLHRWAMRGCRGVKLETVRVGGTLCTSEAAVVRFMERCSAGSTANAPTLSTVASEHQAAEKSLAAIGI